MPGPKPVKIELSQEEETALKKIVKAHKIEQQIAKRGRIILGAHEGKSNTQLTKEVGVSMNTVRLWRSRWRLFQAIPLLEMSVEERLEDDARPGAPARITADQRCEIEKLACEKPEKSGRPLSQWTNWEIADEIKKRGIVDQISARHAGRLLKRSRYQAPSNPLLANTKQG